MPCEEALAVSESVSTCQSLLWSMPIPLRTTRIVFHRAHQKVRTDAVDGSNDVDADDDDIDTVVEDDSIVLEDDNTEIDAGGRGDD